MKIIAVSSCLIGAYCLVAVIVAAAWFVLSKEQNKTTLVVQGSLIGLFWPLTVGIATYVGLFAALVSFLETLDKNLCSGRG